MKSRKLVLQRDETNRIHVIEKQKFLDKMMCVKCLDDVYEFLDYLGMAPKPGHSLTISISAEKK